MSNRMNTYLKDGKITSHLSYSILIILIVLFAVHFGFTDNIYKGCTLFVFKLSKLLLLFTNKHVILAENQNLLTLVNHYTFDLYSSSAWVSLRTPIILVIISLFIPLQERFKIYFFTIGLVFFLLLQVAKISTLIILASVYARNDHFQIITAYKLGIDLIPILLFIFVAILKKQFFSDLKNKIKSLTYTQQLLTSIFLSLYLSKVAVKLFSIRATYIFPFLQSKLADFILYTSYWSLNLMGYHTQVKDSSIIGNNTYVHLATACLGLRLMFLLAIFIAVRFGSWRKKLKYISIGIALIILLNCIRITWLYILLYKYRSLDFLITDHHELFNIGINLVAIILCVIWVKNEKNIVHLNTDKDS